MGNDDSNSDPVLALIIAYEDELIRLGIEMQENNKKSQVELEETRQILMDELIVRKKSKPKRRVTK